MQQRISFPSGTLTLSGVLHVPTGLADGTRRPAIIVLHGFGGSKEGPSHIAECQLYESLGYVALRFDMRGCGESGGTKGHILCEEQVRDAASAVTWLSQQACVDPRAIAISGQSNGGAVAIYSGATDKRVAAIISIGGWGNGARKLAWQNRAPGAWQRLLELIEQGRQLRRETGRTLMIKRWDIVPVPEHMRSMLPPDCIMDFPFDTPLSISNFRPEDVVAQVAPRPFLIVHGANDSVTSPTEALSLFGATNGSAELAVLKGEHFPFVDPDPLLDTLIEKWLRKNLPLRDAAAPQSISQGTLHD